MASGHRRTFGTNSGNSDIWPRRPSTGKSADLLIPTARANSHSVIICDLLCEVMVTTEAKRQLKEGDSFALNPFSKQVERTT